MHCSLKTRFSLSPHGKTRLQALAACALGLALALPAAAQDTAPSAQPDAPPVPLGPPPATAPAPEVAPTPAPSPAADAQAITQQLLALEQQTQQLEEARGRIRLRGVRIGKIVSWTATALFLFSAFSAWGRAQSIDDAIKDGRDDKAYDSNGDGDVNHKDEHHSRRIARSLAITSLVPIGLGVFSTILERRRRAEQRAFDYQIDDNAARRRALLTRLGGALAVAPGHAALQLRLTF
jgi:hypothetical protein